MELNIVRNVCHAFNYREGCIAFN